LFDIIPPSVFLSVLSRGRIALGMVESATEREFVRTPLTTDQETMFLPVYSTFLHSLIELNRAAVMEEQPFLTGHGALLDLSTPQARELITRNGMISVRVSAPVRAAKAQLLTYASNEPCNETLDLPVILNGTDIHVELPSAQLGTPQMLRQGLELHVWP